MTGLAVCVGWWRAVLLVVFGVLLLVAGACASGDRPEPPVWHVWPASQVEDRRWQVDNLSNLIDVERVRDGIVS
ncbi:hypothetical protein QQG74_09990 [Micromonospora sp. FIMYZ51]|uniref:hypothetical protein n=1 Tax=Micromonospora sp. FIMYZ51 TaxID=3051832 RepID=UPI00311FFA27